MSGHFAFQNMTLDGNPIGKTIRVKTVNGLILQCHLNVNYKHVQHMAEIARETPNYPVDISVWSGTDDDRFMVWNARIYWSQ